MSQKNPELAKLRTEIDTLDRKLVELLNERAMYVLGVRQAKIDAGLEQFDPEREAHIHERLSDLNEGPLRDSDLQRIYETLLDVMKTFE